MVNKEEEEEDAVTSGIRSANCVWALNMEESVDERQS